MANEKNGNSQPELKKRLWAAAEQMWTNSSLRPSEYSTSGLGPIILRFIDNAKAEVELKAMFTGRWSIGKTDCQTMVAFGPNIFHTVTLV